MRILNFCTKECFCKVVFCRRLICLSQNLSTSIFPPGELWANDAKIVGWTPVENGIIYAIDKYLFTKDAKADKKKKKAEKDKQAEMDNEIADKRRKNKKAAKVSLDLLSFNEEPGLSPSQITYSCCKGRPAALYNSFWLFCWFV